MLRSCRKENLFTTFPQYGPFYCPDWKYGLNFKSLDVFSIKKVLFFPQPKLSPRPKTLIKLSHIDTRKNTLLWEIFRSIPLSRLTRNTYKSIWVSIGLKPCMKELGLEGAILFYPFFGSLNICIEKIEKICSSMIMRIIIHKLFHPIVVGRSVYAQWNKFSWYYIRP